jgi:molybdopterin converting factor small subunit
VPVTVKLSEEFYDKFGHDVVNELVNWFNQVDATYRTDLRELNELNFARFDAKLEQRAAELEAKLGQRTAALEAKLGQRIAALEAKLGQRIAALEAKLGQRMAALEAKLGQRIAALEARVDRRLAELKSELSLEIASLATALREEIAGAVASLRDELASKAQLDEAIRQSDDRMSVRFDSLRLEMHSALAAHKAELIKWMFVFWAGTTLAVLAVVGL